MSSGNSRPRDSNPRGGEGTALLLSVLIPEAGLNTGRMGASSANAMQLGRDLSFCAATS